MQNPIQALNQINLGYTKSGDFYIKHFDSIDLSEIANYHEEQVKICQSKNLKTLKEKRIIAIEDGEWSDLNEKELYESIAKSIKTCFRRSKEKFR